MMSLDWKNLFDGYGVKKVTRTDKNKAAFVLNAEQVGVLAAAQIEPSDERPAPPFKVKILFDASTDSVDASYYHSKRSKAAGRDPEPRMGREIISSWMKIGDEIVIGNIGAQLYAAKLAGAAAAGPAAASDIASKVDPKTVLARAKKAKGKPGTVVRKRTEYVRNPYVVAGAIVRSDGACEMPGCTTDLFLRKNGAPFLEVHHIKTLAEGGDDTLENAAALCPMCHRELHFGALKKKKRKMLQASILAGGKKGGKAGTV